MKSTVCVTGGSGGIGQKYQSKFSHNWGLPSTWIRFLIIILLLLGVFFRFVNLDRKVYWFDEVYTSLRVSGYTEAELVQQVVGYEISKEDLQKYQRINPEKGLVDTIKGLAQEEPQLTPLYFVMVRFWVQWFGYSVAVTRSFSAVISLLVFPCLYWLCLELFESSLTGWIAIALMAVSPFCVLYAQEARHYSLWTVTILLSSAALLRAMRLNTSQSWGIYAVSLAALHNRKRVKKNKIWLGTAVNKRVSGILAWVLGDRSSETFKHL